MNWRCKAMLQAAFSVLPHGYRLNSAFSRYVTRTLPSPRDVQRSNYLFAVRHVAAFRRHGAARIPDALFFEFGAGWDLMNALSLYALGVNRQIVTDLRPYANPGFVKSSANFFRTLSNGPLPQRMPPLPSALAVGSEFINTLKTLYEIEYRAPFDVRRSELVPGSIDYITTTKVLSYIATETLREMLRECHRVLSPGGMMSVVVDYRDNYSYFDKNISVYNFLRYPDEKWMRFTRNPPLFFQNRLRHCDYIRLFQDAGLKIVEEESSYDGTLEEARERLGHVPLADRFKQYDRDQLLPVRGVFALRKVVGSDSSDKASGGVIRSRDRGLDGV